MKDTNCQVRLAQDLRDFGNRKTLKTLKWNMDLKYYKTTMKVMLILLGQDEASFDNLAHVQLIGGLQGKELRDKWRVIAKQK